jgi:hypothetical protein
VGHSLYILFKSVEVNGGKGTLINKTDSGQGDPLSSILFLIRSELLGKLIATKFPEIVYVAKKGITVGPILFADDNQSLLKLQRIAQLDPFLAILSASTCHLT